VITVPTTTSFT